MTTYFFSNHHRWIKIIIATGLIVALGLYAVVTGPNTEVSFDELKLAPTQYEGQEFLFAGKVIAIDESVYTLKNKGMTIHATGPGPEIKLNSLISGKAIVKNTDTVAYLAVIEYHHHVGQILKIVSGPIILGILGLWFINRYRFNRQQLIWESKSF